MNKPIIDTMDLDQSIKIMNINMNQLQNKIKMNNVPNPKELEAQLSQMAFAVEDLRNKKAKNDLKRESKRIPSLRSDTKKYTATEIAELNKLIDSV